MTEGRSGISPIVTYLKEIYDRHRSPIGKLPKEVTDWARELKIPKRGPTILYAGLYTFAGYSEALLKLSNIFEKNGLRFDEGISLAKDIPFSSYGDGPVAMVRRIGGTPTRIVSAALRGKLSSDGVREIKEVVGEAERLNKMYTLSLTNTARLLRNLGIKFAYLREDEPDSGLILRTFGYDDEFKKHARETYTDLKDRGVKGMISPDPISAYVFRDLYPPLVEGFDIDVKHISQVMAQNMGKIQGFAGRPGRGRGVACWHDPCYMGRYLRITEEPREILKGLGYDLREAVGNRQYTHCDGGGGLEFLNPPLATKIAQERVQELLDTGAEQIITSCAVCKMMLRVGAEGLGKQIKILDLADAL